MGRLRPIVLCIFAAVLSACTAAPTAPPPIPLAERQIAFLEITGDPDWMVAAFESIWVKKDDGDVVRIDPADHEILATIKADVTGGELCQGIGADDMAIWACSEHDIVRIDPATNTVTDVVEVGKVYVQGRLASLAGRVWILTGSNADLLVGVDSSTLEIGPPIALGETCWDLAVGVGAVWVACGAEGHLLRVDPVTASVTARIDVAGAEQASVGPDAVWVVGPDAVVRIDLDDLSTSVVAPGTGLDQDSAIWASSDAIWVRTTAQFLTRIDPRTKLVVERIDADLNGVGDVVGLSGTLWASDSVNDFVVHLRVGAP